MREQGEEALRGSHLARNGVRVTVSYTEGRKGKGSTVKGRRDNLGEVGKKQAKLRAAAKLRAGINKLE